MSKRFWTREEIKYLGKSYPRQGAKHVSKHLNRTIQSVISKAITLGITREGIRHWETYANRKGLRRKSPSRLWTENDKGCLRQHYASETAEEIGIYFGRTVQSIRQCAGRMGLQNKQNWHKYAYVEARVRKFKNWRSQQSNKNQLNNSASGR